MKNKSIRNFIAMLSLWIVTAVVFIGGSFFGLKALLDYARKNEPVIAAADEQYPTANLFNQREYGSRTLNGLSIRYSPAERCFVLNGTVTTTVTASVVMDIPITNGTAYTLTVEYVSGDIQQNTGQWAVFYLGTPDNWLSANLTTSKSSRTLTAPSSSITWSWFYITPGWSFNNYKCRIMLNEGSTAYPYIPNLEEVFSEGYEAAEVFPELGVLYGSTVSYTANFTDANANNSEIIRVVSESGLTPKFYQNALSTEYIAFDLDDFSYENSLALYDCILRIDFAESFIYGGYPLYYAGSGFVTTCTFITEGGARFSGKVDLLTLVNDSNNSYWTYHPILMDNVSGLNVDTLPISAIEFRILSLDALYEFNLFSYTGVSLYDYNSGFNDGLDIGYDKGFSAGEFSGEALGYEKGYDKGLSDAYNKQAEDGSLGEGVRSFVFALFDAPIDTFMSVFNFEVDGFDIGGIVAFIITMSLVVFVCTKVL